MFPEQEIAGYERYWRRRKPGSSTVVHYGSDVRIFFKWINGKQPTAISKHDVDEFIEWQQRLGRAPGTIRRRLIALRMFFDYIAYICEDELANPVIPHRHYIDKSHRLPRDVHQEDIEKLFLAIGYHLRDRTIFTLMLHAGMRVGEVANLCREDVYLSENRVPYLRVTGKGQRERVVYLSATATQLLQEYLASRSTETEEKVFLNRRGKPISITGIQLQLAKYCHQADIWVTCHQLRHTFACRMIAAGVPVTSIQKMLGHSSISTTQLYVRIADRQVEQDYHAGIQKLIESCVIVTEVPHG